MSITENVYIQILFHPPEPAIRDCKTDKTSDCQSDPIPDIRKMCSNYAPDQCPDTEGQTGMYRALKIIEIIQKNNLRLHQKQNEISRCKAGINPKRHASKSDLRKKDHT